MRKMLVSLSLSIAGCSSVSLNTAANLDTNNKYYHTEQCQQAMEEADRHEQIKWARNIISPALTILSGGILLPAVVIGNAQLEYEDRYDANDMNYKCGGDYKSHEEIVAEVTQSSALSIITGTVTPNGLIGTTTNTTTK